MAFEILSAELELLTHKSAFSREAFCIAYILPKSRHLSFAKIWKCFVLPTFGGFFFAFLSFGGNFQSDNFHLSHLSLQLQIEFIDYGKQQQLYHQLSLLYWLPTLKQLQQLTPHLKQ